MTLKEQEKISRNKKKFNEAEGNYNKTISDLVTQCEKILDNRYLLLNPVIVKFVQVHAAGQSKLFNYYAVHDNIEDTMKRNKEKQEEILEKKKMIQSMVEGKEYQKSNYQQKELSIEDELRLEAQQFKKNKSAVPNQQNNNLTIEQEIKQQNSEYFQKNQNQSEGKSQNLTEFEKKLKEFQSRKNTERQTMYAEPNKFQQQEEEKADDPFNQWSSNYASKKQQRYTVTENKRGQQEDEDFNKFYNQYNYKFDNS